MSWSNLEEDGFHFPPFSFGGSFTGFSFGERSVQTPFDNVKDSKKLTLPKETKAKFKFSKTVKPRSAINKTYRGRIVSGIEKKTLLNLKSRIKYNEKSLALEKSKSDPNIIKVSTYELKLSCLGETLDKYERKAKYEEDKYLLKKSVEELTEEFNKKTGMDLMANT